MKTEIIYLIIVFNLILPVGMLLKGQFEHKKQFWFFVTIPFFYIIYLLWKLLIEPIVDCYKKLNSDKIY